MLAGHNPSVHLIRQSSRAVEMAEVSLCRDLWLCDLCSEWVCVCVCARVEYLKWIGVSMWRVKGYLAALQLFSDLHWILGSGTGLEGMGWWRESCGGQLHLHQTASAFNSAGHCEVAHTSFMQLWTTNTSVQGKQAQASLGISQGDVMNLQIPPNRWGGQHQSLCQERNWIRFLIIFQDEFLQEQDRMTVLSVYS